MMMMMENDDDDDDDDDEDKDDVGKGEVRMMSILRMTMIIV